MGASGECRAGLDENELTSRTSTSSMKRSGVTLK